MPFEYETISQKEKIENKDIAKIINYFERHHGNITGTNKEFERNEKFEVIGIKMYYFELFQDIENNISISIFKRYGFETFEIEIYKNDNLIVCIPLKMCASNISGIYASLKNFKI